ncbi:TonB-dependent receptor [Denitratisoma sp. DHT3]|uniref:TonB-dependent receptor n=1 Tax=Denitratisoma sp. DHT3 TaxID=1981880 RepID=UPI00164835B3|nr:TonB-dependent receptor [Denitratisoma sp. DHT3]
MQNQKNLWVVRALPMLIASAFAGSALAAENPESQKLEEVVVTAQKRAERLQDVPISISAISGGQLETRGIKGASTLEGMVPNLSMKHTPGQSLGGNVGIRGITSGQPAIWQDPSVGIYVDGVFVGKNQGALFDLVDLERVEVLRGPQGTLFGRNTEGGAVSLVTRKPSGYFSGNVGFEIGNYGHHVERVSVDLPKVGITSISFALRNEERDGWSKNPNGKDWGSKGRTGARLALNFDISPKFKVDYTYDLTRVNETPTPTSLYSDSGYGQLYPGTAVSPTPNPAFGPLTGYGTLMTGALFANGFNGVPLPYFDDPKLASLKQARQYNMLPGVKTLLTPLASTSYPTTLAGTAGHNYYQKLDVDGQMLSATYELNANNTLKYIGSYRKMHFDDNKDLDGSAAWVYDGGLNTVYSTYSHEFQLIGNTERSNYVVGYYQFKDDGATLSRTSGYFLTMVPGYAGYQHTWYRVTSDAKALFGQVDFKVSDDLTATVGLRRTTEEKGGAYWRTDTCPVNGSLLNLAAIGAMCPTGPVAYQVDRNNGFVYSPSKSTVSFSATTPVFALNYKVNDGLNVYGRLAKGFKSGGFPGEASYVTDAQGNVLSDPRKPFMDERSTAFEVGFKSNFWDGKAQLSAALFRTDVTNFQGSILPPGTLSPTMENAGKARYQGLEIEGMVVLAPGWRMQFGYGYLDPKFIDLMNYNYLGQLVNSAGNTRTPMAPKHTFNMTLDGRLAKTEWGTLRGIVDVSYTGKYYSYGAQIVAADPNGSMGNTEAFSTVKALTNVNARLLLANIPIGGPGAADMSLWVRNLTDNREKVTGIDFGGLFQVANWTEPRTYGMSFNYKW